VGQDEAAACAVTHGALSIFAAFDVRPKDLYCGAVPCHRAFAHGMTTLSPVVKKQQPPLPGPHFPFTITLRSGHFGNHDGYLVKQTETPLLYLFESGCVDRGSHLVAI
jgi:hypothetical protein